VPAKLFYPFLAILESCRVPKAHDKFGSEKFPHFVSNIGIFSGVNRLHDAAISLRYSHHMLISQFILLSPKRILALLEPRGRRRRHRLQPVAGRGLGLTKSIGVRATRMESATGRGLMGLGTSPPMGPAAFRSSPGLESIQEASGYRVTGFPNSVLTGAISTNRPRYMIPPGPRYDRQPPGHG